MTGQTTERPTQGTFCGFPIRFDATMPDDCFGVRGDGGSIFVFIQEEAGRILRLQRELVERRILEGDNRVTVKHGDLSCVYEVPDWKTRPVARIRVERARFNYRKRTQA